MAQTAWDKISQSDWSGAAYFAKAAIASDPNWPEGYRMLNFAQRGLQQFDEARATIPEALSLNSQDFRVLMDAGELERSAGQFASAEAVYRDAPKLRPDNPEIIWKLSRALEVQGVLDEAATLLKKARALSQVLTEQGNYRDALPFLQEVTTRDPDYAFGHYYHALELAKLNRNDEALGAAETAAQLDPTAGKYRELATKLRGSAAQRDT